MMKKFDAAGASRPWLAFALSGGGVALASAALWRALEGPWPGAALMFAMLVLQYLGLRATIAEAADRPRLAFAAGFFLFAPPLVARQVAPLRRPGLFSLVETARRVFWHAAGKLPINAARSGGLAIEGRMALAGYWAALAGLFLAAEPRAWICLAAPPALAAILHHFLPPPSAPADFGSAADW